MKVLGFKFCQDCKIRRSLLERLFPLDDERCDKCHYEFIKSVRGDRL